MKLRNYQEECIQAVWSEIKERDHALVVASTGSGKTLCFVEFIKRCASMMERAEREFKALILVHKVDLVTQTKERFNQFASELGVGLYCGTLNEKNTKEKVTVGSIDSIKSAEIENYNIVIVDEYHRHYNRKSYYTLKDQIRIKNPKCKFIYFTATPYGGRGYVYGNEEDEIKKPCFQIGMTELIKKGFLVEPIFQERAGKFDTKELKTNTNGDFSQVAVINLSKDDKKTKLQIDNSLIAAKDRKKLLWCCTCIEHSETVERMLLELGESAVAVHSKQNQKRQNELVESFEHGPIRHLITVTKLSEGTDIPCIDCIVILRPTRSPILYVQVVGRGLRLFEGKKDCLVLDYGGVVEALGHPKKPYIKPIGKRAEVKERAITCPHCFRLNFYPIDTCGCGYQFLKDERTVDRLQKLKLIPYDPNRANKIAVYDWYVHWNYISKSGKTMVMIVYKTLTGNYNQYILKNHAVLDYIRFLDDYKKGAPPYISLNDKKFVKKRLYA